MDVLFGIKLGQKLQDCIASDAGTSEGGTRNNGTKSMRGSRKFSSSHASKISLRVLGTTM